MQQTVNLSEPPDMSILNCVMARLVQTETFQHPILGLEVLQGPYKGVTFWFSSFNVDMEHLDDSGLAPVKFQTEVYEAPEGFVADEAWDRFCGDIFYAWLSFIQQNDLPPLIKARPAPGIH